MRRNILPMVVMLSSLTLLMGGAAVTQRAVEARNPRPVAINEPALLELDRVASLLESGQEGAAKRALDSLASQPLPMDSGAGGEGALKSFAPTTLLMRTGRAMLARANAAAERGDRIERCRELAGQALACSKPTMDSLNVARYLDKNALMTEVRILKQLNETEQARFIAARGNALQNLWQNRILVRVKSVIERWNREDTNRWDESLNRMATPSPEVREARRLEEHQLATDLIRLYQSQRNGLRVVQNGSDKAA
jgi:hypothetical protein